VTEELPLGESVDATPRPLPARIPHRGASATLEPIGPRHAAELWDALRGAETAFAYMAYGPFASEAALRDTIIGLASQHDPLAWAVRQHRTGTADGWLCLMDIQPRNASIELGGILFSPRLQRTRASTEAMFLLMRHALDELGYRRLTWKCNALNAASRRAAERLGFSYEGTLRAHIVVKGRRRDSAYFSILQEEWPERRNAIAAWLEDSNFGPDGQAKQSLKKDWGAE